MRYIKEGFRVLRVLGKHRALFYEHFEDSSFWLYHIGRLFSRSHVEGRPGQRLAKALYELGPTYIKFGQILSTRSDVIGEEIAKDLSELQDRLPSFDSEEALKTIETSFKQKREDLFESFDPMPVAAASIAQVHRAVTKDGRNVAVKILRPLIQEKMKRDLEFFAFMAARLEKLNPRMKRLKFRQVLDLFKNVAKQETDLLLEAAAASEFQENFKDHPYFKVPRIDWSLTNSYVMTTEYIEGIRIDDLDGIKKYKLNPQDILKHATDAFFKQIFEDGFFHADLHPGNLLVTKEGVIYVLDFGITGRINWQSRFYLGDIFVGFLSRDYKLVTDAHFKAGYVSQAQSRDQFMLACRSIAEPVLDRPLNQISVAKLLARLFKVTEEFHMETQPQLLLLQKSMLIAEGVGRILNPQVNMWELSRPLMEKWTQINRGKKADLLFWATDMAGTFRKLPHAFDQMSAAMQDVHDFVKQYGQKSAKKRVSYSFYALTTGILIALSFFVGYNL